MQTQKAKLQAQLNAAIVRFVEKASKKRTKRNNTNTARLQGMIDGIKLARQLLNATKH